MATYNNTHIHSSDGDESIAYLSKKYENSNKKAENECRMYATKELHIVIDFNAFHCWCHVSGFISWYVQRLPDRKTPTSRHHVTPPPPPPPHYFEMIGGVATNGGNNCMLLRFQVHYPLPHSLSLPLPTSPRHWRTLSKRWRKRGVWGGLLMFRGDFLF